MGDRGGLAVFPGGGAADRGSGFCVSEHGDRALLVMLHCGGCLGGRWSRVVHVRALRSPGCTDAGEEHPTNQQERTRS